MKTRLIWDRVAMELVDPAEYARRQAAREPVSKTYPLPKAVERGHWVYDKAAGQVVEAATYWANKPRAARSELAAPALHGDFNDYVMCPADGVRYGSKGDYRAALRRNGCVEVGNEPIHKNRGKPEYKPVGVVDDIKRAMSEHGVAV